MAPRLPAAFLDEVNAGEGLALAVQPHGLTSLFDFQRRGLTFMSECESHGSLRGGILADEQGVGKTVMCAAIMMHHRRPDVSDAPTSLLATPPSLTAVKGTLVCCTRAIEQQWLHELELHAPSLSVVVFRGRPADATHEAVQREVARLASADVVLASYDVLMSSEVEVNCANVTEQVSDEPEEEVNQANATEETSEVEVKFANVPEQKSVGVAKQAEVTEQKSEEKTKHAKLYTRTQI